MVRQDYGKPDVFQSALRLGRGLPHQDDRPQIREQADQILQACRSLFPFSTGYRPGAVPPRDQIPGHRQCAANIGFPHEMKGRLRRGVVVVATDEAGACLSLSAGVRRHWTWLLEKKQHPGQDASVEWVELRDFDRV